MNKVKYIICTIIFFFFLNLNVTALANSINSENAILYNLDENTILFTKMLGKKGFLQVPQK